MENVNLRVENGLPCPAECAPRSQEGYLTYHFSTRYLRDECLRLSLPTIGTKHELAQRLVASHALEHGLVDLLAENVSRASHAGFGADGSFHHYRVALNRHLTAVLSRGGAAPEEWLAFGIPVRAPPAAPATPAANILSGSTSANGLRLRRKSGITIRIKRRDVRRKKYAVVVDNSGWEGKREEYAMEEYAMED